MMSTAGSWDVRISQAWHGRHPANASSPHDAEKRLQCRLPKHENGLHRLQQTDQRQLIHARTPPINPKLQAHAALNQAALVLVYTSRQEAQAALCHATTHKGDK
jgi:hypothetical protein